LQEVGYRELKVMCMWTIVMLEMKDAVFARERLELVKEQIMVEKLRAQNEV
jgi:hypothetical protein